MRHHQKLAFLFPLALFLAFGLASCSDDDTNDPVDMSGTFFSASQDLGDGSAKLFVTRDADGNPTEVGFRITEDALQGLDTATSVLGFEMIEEGSATVFKYITLDWNPHGHEPIMFEVPHFDMHFYLMTETELSTNINPTDPDFNTKANNLPDAKYVPAGYSHPAPPDSAEAIPAMGLHYVDLANIPNPGEFEIVMIYGAWNGKMHFVEPMMTTAWLMTKPTFEENIAQPQEWQTTGYWPTTYSVDFDDTTNEYVITLGGLTMRTAS